MKKALQNPYVVGILAILAVVIVVRSVTAKPEYAHAPAAPPGGESSSTSKSTSSALATGNRIDAALAGWTSRTERDPFRVSSASTEETEKGESGDADPPVTGMPVPSPDLPLTAVWIENDRRIAVIDGQLREAGEHIRGFRIVSILPDRVIVEGQGGRAVLEFPEADPPGRTDANVDTDSGTPFSERP